ncbi:MAG: hypothetical protein ACRDHD_02940, partial [Candidatus Limnocylindria bacterium]
SRSHPRAHRSHPRAHLTLILAAALVGVAAGVATGAATRDGPRFALALFTDGEAVPAVASTASSFTATTYYLHNNPTPPTGATNAQANLGMNTTAPSATFLFNYDANLDAGPGRLIQRGGSGAGETNLARYQNWRGPTLPAITNISGTVTVEFWSAMRDFTPGVAGEVNVFVRAYDPLLGAIGFEIGSATVSAADWQGGTAGWVKRLASMNVSTTLGSCLLGCQLEVKLTVGGGAADDMWLGYDTTVHRSRLRLP